MNPISQEMCDLISEKKLNGTKSKYEYEAQVRLSYNQVYQSIKRKNHQFKEKIVQTDWGPRNGTACTKKHPHTILKQINCF